MKICPICQQSFPNGFQYCPNDTELLLTQEDNQRVAVPPSPEPVREVVARPRPANGRETVDLRSTGALPGRTEPPPVVPEPTPAPTQSLPPLPPKTVETTGRLQTGQTGRTAQSVKAPSPPASEPRVNVATDRAVPATAQGYIAPRSAVGELNFTMPDEGSLISRLTAVLRNIGEILRKPVGGSTSGTGFQFLLVEDSLSTRISREFSAAGEEFRRDPKRFMVELTRGEGSNLRRRNMLLAGSEMAVVGLVTAYFALTALSSATRSESLTARWLFIAFIAYLVGCYLVRGLLLLKLINRATNRLVGPKIALEIANWLPLAVILILSVVLSNYNFYCSLFPGRCVPPEAVIDELALLTPLTDVPTDIKVKVEKSAAVKERKIGGSLKRPKAASGGGGGGRSQPTPPSKGVPPPMALTPQIVMPNPEPPKIKNPSLAVVPTIYGDPRALPPMKGPIGDPGGVPGPPSSGPGTGAGIGRGSGTGVGTGDGGGAGAGRGGNTGGGDMGLGGGRSVEPMSASLRPTILYKEKAKYTEEARQNKVQGTVVLNVVFTSDARITSIKVVRGLPDGLTEKAIEAAQRIRFNPAVKGGVPVSVRGNLEFTFNLY